MKKLEDFMSEKVELSSIYGGGVLEPRTETSHEVDNGNCCDVTTDNYNDENCNGQWDSNEWGTSWTRTVC
jgi:hypothetical protein